MVFFATVSGVVVVVFKFLWCWLHGRPVFLFCATAFIGRAPQGVPTHAREHYMQSLRHVVFIFLAASPASLGVAHCQGSPKIVSARYAGGITDKTLLYGDVKKVSPTCNNHSPVFKLHIPNGTQVWNNDHPTIHDIWKNGNAVPWHDKGGLKKVSASNDGIR